MHKFSVSIVYMIMNYYRLATWAATTGVSDILIHKYLLL